MVDTKAVRKWVSSLGGHSVTLRACDGKYTIEGGVAALQACFTAWARCRQDVPALCDDLDRLREENERLRANLDVAERAVPPPVRDYSVTVPIPGASFACEAERRVAEKVDAILAHEDMMRKREQYIGVRQCDCASCRARREQEHREREEQG